MSVGAVGEQDTEKSLDKIWYREGERGNILVSRVVSPSLYMPLRNVTCAFGEPNGVDDDKSWNGMESPAELYDKDEANMKMRDLLNRANERANEDPFTQGREGVSE